MIHSETRTWHDKNIQWVSYYRILYILLYLFLCSPNFYTVIYGLLLLFKVRNILVLFTIIIFSFWGNAVEIILLTMYLLVSAVFLCTKCNHKNNHQKCSARCMFSLHLRGTISLQRISLLFSDFEIKWELNGFHKASSWPFTFLTSVQTFLC